MRLASRLCFRVVCLAGLGLLLAGCAAGRTADAAAPLAEATFTSALSVPDIGAGQGVEYRDGKVYLYGDADTGVIREFRLEAGNPLRLEPTGVEMKLTQQGVDVVAHPTGLTHRPGLGTFLGDTVRGQGVIYHVDWQRLRAQGTLDHAVLNRVQDDLAVNGTRPEFVRFGGRWLVATADYGDRDNRVRLYDPQALARARRTSDPGVLVASFPCGPWVQNLHWIDEHGLLVLVQNQVEGLRWRFTFARLEGQSSLRHFPPRDVPEFADELEGFTLLEGDQCLAVSSSRRDNVRLGVLRVPAPQRALVGPPAACGCP